MIYGHQLAGLFETSSWKQLVLLEFMEVGHGWQFCSSLWSVLPMLFTFAAIFFYVKFMYYILILKGCVCNLVTSFWD